MDSDEIRARAQVVLSGLSADKLSLDTALSVLVTALCSITANNGVPKNELMHNVSSGYDQVLRQAAASRSPERGKA